jgi:hypothetical protein
MARTGVDLYGRLNSFDDLVGPNTKIQLTNGSLAPGLNTLGLNRRGR